MNRRFEITDEEWDRLAPLLPAMTPKRGGRWRDHRQVLNGILFRVRSGVPWRDLPERVLVWDPSRPGSDPVQLGGHDRWVKAVAVLPDGRVVSSGSDQRVLIWYPTTQGQVAQLGCSVEELACREPSGLLPTRRWSPRTGLTLRSGWSQRRDRAPASCSTAVPQACHSQRS